jgi:hypothetical protein
MGVNLIVIVENLKGLNQEEVNEALGVEVFEHKGKREVYPNWELFEWEGKSYASWTFTPRTFDGLYDIFTYHLDKVDPFDKVDEDTRKRWESLRKYLAKVRRLFGNGKVYIGNDFIYFRTPSEAKAFGEEFFLPLQVPEELLEEPDFSKYPELRYVKELEHLTW